MALIAALGTELIPITRHPSQPSVCTEMVSLLILLKLVLPHASHHSENLKQTQNYYRNDKFVSDTLFDYLTQFLWANLIPRMGMLNAFTHHMHFCLRKCCFLWGILKKVFVRLYVKKSLSKLHVFALFAGLIHRQMDI